MSSRYGIVPKPTKEVLMTINVQAVKFAMDEGQKEFINKKFDRIKYAEDLITDISCKIKYDKQFSFDCTVNFKGGTAHVSTEEYDFGAGVNKMMDMLDLKVRKEKEKYLAKQ